jgi:hypothetical protein
MPRNQALRGSSRKDPHMASAFNRDKVSVVYVIIKGSGASWSAPRLLIERLKFCMSGGNAPYMRFKSRSLSLIITRT